MWFRVLLKPVEEFQGEAERINTEEFQAAICNICDHIDRMMYTYDQTYVTVTVIQYGTWHVFIQVKLTAFNAASINILLTFPWSFCPSGRKPYYKVTQCGAIGLLLKQVS